MSILHPSLLKVLVIDKSDADLMQLVGTLQNLRQYVVHFDIATNYRDGVSQLVGNEYDVCFAIERIGEFDGVDFVREVISRNVNSPIVILSGSEHSEVAVEAMKAGAVDYQLKSSIEEESLERVIRYALERRVQQQLIREKQEVYEKVFRLSTDAMFFCNSAGKFLEVNSVFRKDLFDPEEMHLNLFQIMGREKDQMSFRNVLHESGRVQKFRFMLKIGDGQMRNCLLSFLPLDRQVEEGEVRFVGSIQDVSAVIDAERKLHQAARMSMTGRLARVIGHEIRNPLTNIGLGVSQLRDGIGDDDEDAVFLLDLITRNADRIERLIRELLDSAKPVKANLVKCDVEDLMEDTLRTARDRIDLMGVNLKYVSDDKLPKLNVDLPKMKIALLNLIINAIEAMKGCEDKDLIVKVAASDEEVCFAVRDSGIGMDNETLEKIFDPFFTGKEHGTGMGLSAVQGIVRAHGGTIEVSSEKGNGTTFLVRLPISGPS